MSVEENESRPVTVAVIGLVGVIGGALITGVLGNWDTLTKRPPPQLNEPRSLPPEISSHKFFSTPGGELTASGLGGICQGKDTLIVSYAATFPFHEDRDLQVVQNGIIQFPTNNTCPQGFAQGYFRDYNSVIGKQEKNWDCYGTIVYSSSNNSLTWNNISGSGAGTESKCPSAVNQRFPIR